MGRHSLVIAGVLGLAILASGCKTAVGTSDEAARFIDDIVRAGKSPTEFKLADDASPLATSAFGDTTPLESFRKLVEQLPQPACAVAGIVSDASDAVPYSAEPIVLEPRDRDLVFRRARGMRIPDETTTRVVDIAVEMAESTWLKAADTACDIAQSGV